jgi:hypothetical protein
MPSKHMRHMFEICSLALLAIVTAGMLSAILVPCKVSYNPQASNAVVFEQ